MLSTHIASALDAVLEEKCKSANVPGMAVIAAQNGQPVFEKYYGYRDMEWELPVTAETIFGVASITKSLTALAIMQLADKGKLTVDDAIVQWLPELKLPAQEKQEEVKIRHLLSHTSGLPGMDAVNRARGRSILNDPDGEYLFDGYSTLTDDNGIQTVTELMETMSQTEYSLLGPPGTIFNYSNEGYALLQEIIERASDQPYIDYIEEHIFHPLNMRRSVFLTKDLLHKEDATQLYAYRKDRRRTIFHSPCWWDVGAIYSNGSLKTCAADLLKYMEIYRLDGLIENEQLVSKESVQQMTAIQATMPVGDGYGFGLQVESHGNIPLVGHGGSIKGVSCHMKIAKEQGLTVVVLVNLAEVAAEDLALTVLAHLLGIQEQDKKRLPEYQLSQEQLKNFAGSYRSAEGQAVDILLEEERLYLEGRFENTPLIPYEPDGFYTPGGEKLKFLLDGSGNVNALFKGVRVIPKVEK